MNRLTALKYLIVIIALLLSSASYAIMAQAHPVEDVEYTVVRGDSLSKIAKKFGVSVEDLYEANNLKSDLIFVGMKLIIPGKPKTQTYEEASPPPSEKPALSPERTPPPAKKPSTIKKEPPVSDKPQILEGRVGFKWAFVARLDPEGRNKVVNIAENTLKASSANFSVTAGDKIAFYVEPGESTYVYIYLLDSRKNLEPIFPTGMDKGTLESEFTSGKGTYVPGKYEWFSFDESRGTETFYVLASSKRLTRLEQLTRNYINSDNGKDAAKQKVLDEIRGTKRLVAFKSPIERPISFGGRIRGLEIDIARLAVEVEADKFYSKTISIRHE